jgi:ActR/RegA family two-component response regulator
MRKKSKYKPRGVRLDTMHWVVSGMTKVSAKESEYVTMHLKNMSALDSLTKGTATRQEADIIIGVINVAEALCMLGVGVEYLQLVLDASSALYAVCKRSLKLNDRFVCRGEELSAIKTGYEVHNAQLEVCTLAMLDKALDTIAATLKQKKGKIINA